MIFFYILAERNERDVVIFMEDHIPRRPDRSLLIGIQTSKSLPTLMT